MNTGNFDIAIVGAGIVGAACADECARAGLRVAVVEENIIGGGATAAGMGHIVVIDDSDPQFALTRHSQQLWQQLRADLPADVEYEQCGTIWVAADEEEMIEVRRKFVYYSGRGVPVEILTGEELARLEPNLRKGIPGGLLVSEDAVLYPPCATRFLLERARAHGAELHAGGRVTHIGNGSVQLANGSTLSAAKIVNAAGAWAPQLTPGIDVKKRKGHLVITDRYPGFLRHQLVELGYLKSAHNLSADSVAFNVQPRQTGQVLIGSSRQYGAEGDEVDRVILNRMLERALSYMPSLAHTSTIRVWTGFRAATPDKLPLIGPSLEDSSVYLATGHEGLGITTSLGTASLVADQLLGRKSVIAPEPYLPSRVANVERTHA